MLEELPSLLPIDFFSLSIPLFKKGKKSIFDKSFLLPHPSDLMEETFADVYMAREERALFFGIELKKNTEWGEVLLFIDTRDMKTKSSITPFCHVFFFTKDKCEERTKFREEMHPLCDRKDLLVSVSSERMSITLPFFVLHGYGSFSRLGFSYRINCPPHDPQHLSCSSKEFALENNPSLWASMRFS